MSFRIPSLAETRDFLVAVGKAIFPDRNYANRRSYHARRASFLSAGVTQLHAHIDAVQNDVMPDSAGEGAPITRWGGIWKTRRNDATPARKASAGRVRGAAATPVAKDEELVHQASGLRFAISTSTVVGVDEYVDADIVAIDTGARTRLTKGEVLEFVATPAGLQTSVTLVADLDEDGLDFEPYGAYRERVLGNFSAPTAGGTQADYVKWMLELSGVTSGYCYLDRAGLGTTDLVGLHTGSGAARELDAGDQATLLAYVRERAPGQVAGRGGALRHLDLILDEEDVEIVLDPSGELAYAFDWTGGPLTVLAWEPGGAARKLQFAADRPASMKAGHRLSFKGVASVQSGAEFVIEALSGTDAVILQTAPAIAPVATDLVYSGGPLVTPVRAAIVAHMNGEKVYAGRGRVPRTQTQLDSTGETTVGLEVLVEGIGPANPGGKYGAWNGDLLRSLLYQIAMYKGGVRNATIAVPAADVIAADLRFPDDNQITLIVPRSVLVRGAT